jgi:hypothetical protein
MNRRAFIAAPAFLAVIPASAAVEPDGKLWSPDDIRERNALGVEAFTQAMV